jgi:hypothetical protein
MYRGAFLTLLFKCRRFHFYKHMNTSPSSFKSAALSAYRQSITDIKSVASFNDGFTLSYRTLTATGPFLISSSTIGMSDKVLFL